MPAVSSRHQINWKQLFQSVAHLPKYGLHRRLAVHQTGWHLMNVTASLRHDTAGEKAATALGGGGCAIVDFIHVSTQQQ